MASRRNVRDPVLVTLTLCENYMQFLNCYFYTDLLKTNFKFNTFRNLC